MNSVRVQKRFGTTSLTVRMVPSVGGRGDRHVLVGDLGYRVDPVLTAAPADLRVHAADSIVHSLLVRGAEEKKSAGCASSTM